MGAEYCDKRVCLCRRLSVYQQTFLRNSRPSSPISVHVPLCRDGSVLLRRRCDALCTSGFIADVTLLHSTGGRPTVERQAGASHDARSHYSAVESRIPRLSNMTLPAAAARAPAAVERYLLHASELSSKPVARRCCWRLTGQTDGRTDVTQTLYCMLCGQHQ